MPKWIAVIATLFCGLVQADDFVPFVIPADVNPKSLIALPAGPAIKPAGVRITIKDDKFYVGQERFKVWGVNMCFGANFPTHKDAERVAARLAAFGINSVRFHHMDSANYPAGLWDPKEKNKFHPEALERLDYFIDQLAQKGIYANINLHVGREHTKTLDLPDGNESQNKMIDIFTPQLIEAQKQYARDLLGHVNQYRKVRYADDAAVGFVEINNEDSLFMWSAPSKLPKLPEYYAKLLQEKYVAWLKQKYGTTDKLCAAWDKDAVPLGPNLLPKELALAAGGKSGWHLEQHNEAKATVKPLEDTKLAGVRVEIVKSDNDGWHIQFNHPGLAVAGNKPHTVSFQARADAPRTICYSVGMAHEPWSSLGLNGTADLTKEWQTFKVGFTPSADDANGRLNFQLSGNSASVELADVTFQVGGGEALDPSESLEEGKIVVFPANEPKLRQYDRLKFLAETERAFFNDMKQFLKKDLGCQAMMTGTIVFGPLGLWAQQDMDYIDAHAYWQHPHFPGRSWDLDSWTIEQKAMVDTPEKSTLPTLAASRLAGKPFTVSEYNHPAPNDYQVECVPMLAAFGAAQDWDGVWFFAYSHNQEWDKPYFDSFFDMRSNPAKWGFMLSGGVIFKTAESNPAKITILEENASMETLCALEVKHHLDMASSLRDVAGIPTRQLIRNPQAVWLKTEPAPKNDFGKQLSDESITWEAPNDRSGVFAAKLKYPALAIVGDDTTGEQAERIGSIIRLKSSCAFTSVQLPDHRKEILFKVLVTLCGRCENTEMKFSADRRSVGRNWGSAPTRIEAVNATIVTRGKKDPGEKVAAYALGPDGVPTAELPVLEAADKKSFHCELGPKYGTMWYLLVVEKAK